MTTRVLKVNGINPNEWQGNPGNEYCGRRVIIKNGPHYGAVWENIGFGNCYKFEADDTDEDKRLKLFHFVQGLNVSLLKAKMLRNRFAKLAGKNLGCWCLNWDGEGRVPLCHAAWLARIVDLFEETVDGKKAVAVSVNSTGGMLAHHLELPKENLTTCVIRRLW